VQNTPIRDEIARAVWGWAPGQFIIIGDNDSYAVSGSSFTPIPGLGVVGLTVHGLADAGSIFAGGSKAKVFRLDGGAWELAWDGSPRTDEVRGLWVNAPDDIWACGQSSLLVHFDGSSWNSVDAGLGGEDLNRIWAGGPHDVWIVGQYGVVLHWNGTSWDRFDYTGIVNHLWGVWGNGIDLWVAGSFGTVARWGGGKSWETLNTGVSDGILGLWGSGRCDLFFSPKSFPDGGHGPVHWRRR
jgi:hypothetical protein